MYACQGRMAEMGCVMTQCIMPNLDLFRDNSSSQNFGFFFFNFVLCFFAVGCGCPKEVSVFSVTVL